jgi:hypothetical protein
MSVRYIHTQAQAQAELERERAAQKASYARRKERMLNDAEYREQQLQRWKVKRDQKRKTIEENPLHPNRGNDADRVAKVRRVARDAREALDAQEREDMIEKVHQRYFSYNFLY